MKKQPLKETLKRIGGGHLLIENKKIFKYKNTLEAYLKQLRPSIKGWKFAVDHMSGAWEWYNPKFEDVIYATWGWEGKNGIPLETSDGVVLKAAKLKFSKFDHEDADSIKKDAKKYIDTMKKELPKLQKKMLDY